MFCIKSKRGDNINTVNTDIPDYFEAEMMLVEILINHRDNMTDFYIEPIDGEWKYESDIK